MSSFLVIFTVAEKGLQTSDFENVILLVEVCTLYTSSGNRELNYVLWDYFFFYLFIYKLRQRRKKTKWKTSDRRELTERYVPITRPLDETFFLGI